VDGLNSCIYYNTIKTTFSSFNSIHLFIGG